MAAGQWRWQYVRADVLLAGKIVDMNGQRDGGGAAYLAILDRYALTPRQRRVLHRAVVNGSFEGLSPGVDAIGDLAEFVAGRISSKTCHQRALARAGISAEPASRRLGE